MTDFEKIKQNYQKIVDEHHRLYPAWIREATQCVKKHLLSTSEGSRQQYDFDITDLVDEVNNQCVNLFVTDSDYNLLILFTNMCKLMIAILYFVKKRKTS